MSKKRHFNVLHDIMEINIDYRENKLIKLLENIHQNSNSKESSKISLHVSNLQLGDVTLNMNSKNTDIKDHPDIIIERKSISDLLSSITDGRYKEQSYRLQNSSLHNHNIIYLIEGNIDTYKQYYASKQNAHLQYYSALFSLYYYKGFSVFITQSIEQTASMMYHFALKIVRSHKKYTPHFLNVIQQPKPTQEVINNIQDTTNSSNNDSQVQYEYDSNSDLNYLQCIKSEKKQNITRDNIWQIMLMQVPYVSDKIALSLLEYYHDIPNLVYELQQDPDCLNNFKIVDSNGKARKLSSKVIANIFELLV